MPEREEQDETTHVIGAEQVDGGIAEATQDLAASDESAGSGAPEEIVTDEVLVAAVDIAREALIEITPASSIGEPAGYSVEGPHLVSLHFACLLPGYPGWHWTVSLSRVDDESEPNVLEAELLPNTGALLAPDWLPWSERLAEYHASQKAEAEARAAAGDDEDEDGSDELDSEDEVLDDDDLESDEGDFDEDESDDDDESDGEDDADEDDTDEDDADDDSEHERF